MRFIYNNQIYVVDNNNECFQIFDLSVDTFKTKPIKNIQYSKIPAALKKFINQNRVYLDGDLYKENQIQLYGPQQITFQSFITKQYTDFIDNKWYVQRKIDGFRAYIYLLTKPIPFDKLTKLSDVELNDKLFFKNETLFEGEYSTNEKYYVFSVVRHQQQNCLLMKTKDNFKLCEDIIKQQLTIDFKIKNKDKQLNVFDLKHIEIKLQTMEDYIKKFKELLEAQTSSTIHTDGFVFYKVDATISERIMYKLKPTNDTSCEFILKWNQENVQYTLQTIGTFKDFQLSNSGIYTKSIKNSNNSKLGGYEFEFKLPFYLNTMSHIYKPKLDDPLGEIALKGELDGKICECAWHNYNDLDPYPSRVVPQKIRMEVNHPSQITSAISCYLGSILSFTNFNKTDIKDTQLYNEAPQNFINLFSGANIPQQDKPTMFVYQANSKNFLGGLKDITNFRFVYIFQNSMSLQINIFKYIRQQLLHTQPQKDDTANKSKSNKGKTDSQQIKKLSRFPNWYIFQQQKLQQIIVKQNIKFDILRIEDNFDELLNDITQINTFDIIAKSSQELQIIDSKKVIPGTPFEKYLKETFTQQKQSTIIKDMSKQEVYNEDNYKDIQFFTLKSKRSKK